MGCVSSKLIEKEIQQENTHKNGECISHVVSLTSSTYGLLKLDKEIENQPQKQEAEVKKNVKECVVEVKKMSPSREEPSEIINAWELMEGLEEDNLSAVVQSKRSPKSRPFLRFSDMDVRSPLKFLNQVGSPRKPKKVGGKENKGRVNGGIGSPRKPKKVGGKENKGRVNGGIGSLENSPKTVLRECNSVKKPSPRLWASIKGSPNVKRCNSLRIDSGTVLPRRRSLGPLFDPELVASLEKEVPEEEEEEIKKIVSASVSSTPAPRKKKTTSEQANAILDSYKKVCPPGGENAVVIYTTTLRGIRKTFEDCNLARSIIESQNVQLVERDISMDSGFKEELRGLMRSKEVKVPLVFVKGRLIGGADEMVKLDEEGKLGILLDGIPKAGAGCVRCGGIRFVMCMYCSGSCKVLGEDGKKSMKCSKCNENGLIQCPVCS